ncbi:MAG: 4Fe-4S binding protein [Deltaproteobacteria bacterium]|nr:4Fe-4S binding protein [Deltaproteobacteria bacterium]
MRTPFSREFVRLALSVGLSPLKWAHAYVYFSYTSHYVDAGTALGRNLPKIPRWLEKWALSSYRGKAAPLPEAKKMLEVNQTVNVRGLERTLPLSAAKDAVWRTGDKILVAECACRELAENPCKPTEVCLFFGKEVAEFVHKQKPDKSRWISQQDAVAILEDAHARGWAHLTFSRDITADRYFVICNCCPCCCKAFYVYNQLKVPMLYGSGHRAEVSAACKGCGRCVAVCPVSALSLTGKKKGKKRQAVVDAQACLGCGACLSQCPEEALSLVRVPEGLHPVLGYH